MASEPEVAYNVQCIEAGVRSDGRGCDDFRAIELELGVIAQASGSSRLHLGATDVIVGVKVELSTPAPESPGRGMLTATVEYSSCASPEYEGKGGALWGAELERAMQNCLAAATSSGSGLDLEQLSVVSGKHCWALFVDALVLNDDGNVLDALSFAAKAALCTTRLPHVDVTGEGGEEDLDVDDDPNSGIPLKTAGVPVIITVSQVGHVALLDATAAEEGWCSAAAHIAVSQQGMLCGITKSGTAGLDPAVLQVMLQVAQLRGKAVSQELEQYVAATIAEA